MKQIGRFILALLIITIFNNAFIFSQVENDTLSTKKVDQYYIGSVRDVFVTKGTFFDNGGESGNLINKYAITTFHANNNQIEISFSEFNIPVGAQIRIYKGNSFNDELFGVFESNDKIWNVKAQDITIEYIPANKNVSAQGWKGIIKTINSSSKSIESMIESDCPYAIPLCQNQTVTVSMNQYTDCGTVNDDSGDCYSGTGSGGSVWYSFVPQTTGPLDFSITPSGSTDYDFVVWNISNGCGSKTQVLCNYEAAHGTTGANSSGTGVSLGSSGGLWCSRPTVTAGVTYAICINFYGGSNDGYVLQFQNEPSSVAITDNTPPTITNAYVNSCTSATTLDIYFSEFVQCPTIQGSDFTLAGYTFTLANDYCNVGRTNHITLNVSPALTPGTYSIHGQDILDMCNNNLNSNYSVVISSPPTANAGPDVLMCKSPGPFGIGWSYSPSSQTLTASGGTSYLWSTGSNVASTSVSPTSTTTYTVTVASGACTATDNVTVSVDLAPTPNIGADFTMCSGFPMTLNASGGGTYVWQVQTGANFFGQPTFGTIAGATSSSYSTNPVQYGSTGATYYQVIVTSPNGCTGTDQVMITFGAGAFSASASPSSICVGSSSTLSVPSSITAYSWTGGPTNTPYIVTPATTTTYTVTSTTAGCTGTADVTVVVNPLPVVTAIASNLTPCSGDVITLNSTPGPSSSNISENFEGATHIFTLVNGSNNKWYQGTAAFASGTKGLYIGTSNADNNYDIGGTFFPPPIAATNFAYKDISVTSYCNANLSYKWKCNGQAANAELSVWLVPTTYTPTAGTAITAGGGNILIGGPFYGQTTYQTVSFNMSSYAGQTVRLVYQWMNTGAAIIGGPTVANPAASIDDFAFTESLTYTYSWTSVPAGFTSIVQSPTVSPTVNTTYNLTTTRCDGCSNTASTSITMCGAPVVPVANFSVSDTTICVGTCVNFTDLSTGGPTSWSWTFAGATIATSTVQNPTGICYNTAGSYNVTLIATNSNGSNTIVKNLFIIVTPQITPSFAAVGPYCSGAAIPALPTTSTNGITGTWSPAINNTTTASYTFTPTAGQCATTTTLSITINTSTTPTITGATSFCTGGSTTLDAGAGYSSYNWTPSGNTQSINVTAAGTYTVTVSNASSCTGTASVTVTVNSSLSPTVTGNNICAGGSTTLDAGSGYASYVWSPSGNTQTIVVNAAGTYLVTVTDATSCSGTGQITITSNPNPTPNITGALSICSGASTTLDAGAGYTVYNWSPSGNSQTISASTSGNYSVTVTDANTCTGTDQVTVTVSSSLSPSISGATSFCTGGSTTLDAGTGYAGYLWSTSSVMQTISVTTAGTYSVTVADASGCTGTTSVTVTVNSSLSPTVVGNDFCAGNSSLLDAGSGYSSYLWSTTEITQTINVFAAGTYSVTVSNATGCTGTGQVTINQNSNPVPDITGQLSFCTGFSTTLDAGAGFTSYLWSNSAITQTTSVNTAGNYSVTVTNVSGCTGTDLVTTVISSNLSPVITGNIQICSGSSTTLDAGTGYAGYLWSNSLNTQSITVSNGGNYSVTVSDISGCTGSATTTVSLNPNPTTLITGNLSMCFGATTVLDAGTGFASYLWTDGTTSQTINATSSGVYTVTVTNTFGCTGTATVTVDEGSNVIVSAATTHSICNGEWAYLTATASGGTAPYVYYWNNTASSASIGVQPTIPTSYTVSVTDANGCVSNIVNVNVNVSLPLQIDVEALPTSICPNDPVQLTVTVNQGGGPPYSVYTSDGTVYIPPILIYPQNSGLQWLYVQDGCGSVAHDSVFITVNPIPSVNFVSDTTAGCEPLTVSFTPMNPQPGQTYYWNFGDGSYNQISYDLNPVHSFAQDGIFDVSLTITSPEGCSSTYMHNDMIHVYPLPSARFVALPSSASIVKPEIHFINYTDFASSYIWSFGDGDSSSVMHPWHWYSSIGSYLVQLIAISDMGCVDTAASVVVIRDEYTFYAPNVISPDFDELNDVFYVVGNGISKKDFQMYIYDRWGEIIFETDKYDPEPEVAKQLGWDGRAKNGAIVPVGTYTWLVKYYDGDHIQHDKSGVVNVIR